MLLTPLCETACGQVMEGWGTPPQKATLPDV